MGQRPTIKEIDRFLIDTLTRLSLPALRISLGIIFIWFGAPFSSTLIYTGLALNMPAVTKQSPR